MRLRVTGSGRNREMERKRERREEGGERQRREERLKYSRQETILWELKYFTIGMVERKERPESNNDLSFSL